MEFIKPSKQELLENQRYLEKRLNDLQQQFNALTRHLKLNVYKPLSQFEVKEMPQYGIGGLVQANQANTLTSPIKNA